MKDGDKDGTDSGSNDIVKRGEDGICGDGVMRRALNILVEKSRHSTLQHPP